MLIFDMTEEVDINKKFYFAFSVVKVSPKLNFYGMWKIFHWHLWDYSNLNIMQNANM